MNTSVFVRILKIVYRALPYLISALAGAGTTVAVSGCKIGSLVSISNPVV